MSKDRFGYGIEDIDATEVYFKGIDIPPKLLPAAKEIAKDFGDSFGNDLSLTILMHYENTGELLKLKDINERKLKELKKQYNIFEKNDPNYQRHMGLNWDEV